MLDKGAIYSIPMHYTEAAYKDMSHFRSSANNDQENHM